MHPSPPVRAPKLQLAVEHPLIGEHQNSPKKDTPHSKTKKSQQDSRRGTILIKSNAYPAGGRPTDWRTIIPKKFLHHWKGSEPHQASQPDDLTKGLGIPRESSPEGQQDLIIGLPEDWEK